MKLLVLVLALSCVVAYTTAQKKGQYWPANTKIFTTPRRFRREADPQNSIANSKNTPQLPSDDNAILRLARFGNEPTVVDFGEDDNGISGSQPRPNGQSNDMHRIDENDYLSAYTFHPGAYGGFAKNFGTGGGFRWRREADVERRFRFRS
ncbi:PREDICTED: uncharacterized protein LOC105566200 [Vollenhovia emeryi]|uniref:uncharacterized protein LOC105566200 n=1 Tax=Vollenhovia emeryi TaxID=411798 RepID=UPI0005F3E883|nr:PREDICTED: uncharacterized protein LOC105566200 [Vollenhovia emeryi]